MPHRVEKWGGHGTVPPANGEERSGPRRMATAAQKQDTDWVACDQDGGVASARLQQTASNVQRSSAADAAATAAAPAPAAPAAAAAAHEKRGGSRRGDPQPTTTTTRTPEGEAAARGERAVPLPAETARATAAAHPVPVPAEGTTGAKDGIPTASTTAMAASLPASPAGTRVRKACTHSPPRAPSIMPQNAHTHTGSRNCSAGQAVEAPEVLVLVPSASTAAATAAAAAAMARVMASAFAGAAHCVSRACWRLDLLRPRTPRKAAQRGASRSDAAPARTPATCAAETAEEQAPSRSGASGGGGEARSGTGGSDQAGAAFAFFSFAARSPSPI